MQNTLYEKAAVFRAKYPKNSGFHDMAQKAGLFLIQYIVISKNNVTQYIV